MIHGLKVRKMIKNIVFDVGGVLVDFCYMEYMRKLGFPEEVCKEFESDIVFSQLWNDMDMGNLLLDEARVKFKERLREMYRPCDREVDLFVENIKGIVKEYDYSKPLLQRLKDSGYGVYIQRICLICTGRISNSFRLRTDILSRPTREWSSRTRGYTDCLPNASE